MPTHDMAPLVCPVCQSILDESTNLDGERDAPQHGDITCCFNCGTLFTFDVDRLRLPRLSEFMALDMESQRLLSVASAQIVARGRLR